MRVVQKSFNLWPLSVQLNGEIIHPDGAIVRSGLLFLLIRAGKLTNIWLKSEQMMFLKQQFLVG